MNTPKFFIMLMNAISKTQEFIKESGDSGISETFLLIKLNTEHQKRPFLDYAKDIRAYVLINQLLDSKKIERFYKNPIESSEGWYKVV